MLQYLIEALGGAVDPVIGWLMDGGLVLLLTYTMTALITRNKKQRWKMEGKEEDIETLIVAILNMKGMVMGMMDIVVLVFSTSKGITEEVRLEMYNHVDKIKKEYGARIDQHILDTIALVKVTKKKVLNKVKDEIEETKGEAMSVIDTLAAKANEIVSKELNKD